MLSAAFLQRTQLIGITLALLSATNGVAQDAAQEDNCNYLDAANNYGWGWDPISQNSCEPKDPDETIELYIAQLNNDNATDEEQIAALRNEYCNYSEADLHDDWGWNNVLLESCPPIENEIGAPAIISDFTLLFPNYPLHPHVSSDSTIYIFQPAVHTLVARQLDGATIWETPAENSAFITDIQLTPEQDQLIMSSLGGKLFSYHTIGTTAIIAHFDPVESSTVEPFIMSYNLDGTTRWKFEHNLKIDEFTLGRDDLVYVTLDTADDSDSKRIVVLQP